MIDTKDKSAPRQDFLHEDDEEEKKPTLVSLKVKSKRKAILS